MNIYTKYGRIKERESQLVNVRGMVILTRVEMRKAPTLVEPYCIKMDTYECRGRACDSNYALERLSFRCARCLLQNFHLCIYYLSSHCSAVLKRFVSYFAAFPK